MREWLGGVSTDQTPFSVSASFDIIVLMFLGQVERSKRAKDAWPVAKSSGHWAVQLIITAYSAVQLPIAWPTILASTTPAVQVHGGVLNWQIQHLQPSRG